MKTLAKKLFTLLILLIVVVGGFYLTFLMSLKPVSSESETVTFTINNNDNLTTITKRLKSENIIKSDWFLKLYGKIFKVNNFLEGSFELDKADSADEILKFLTNSKNIISNEITITFKEGLWAKEIAEIIEDKLGIDKDELLVLWNDVAYLKSLQSIYPFITEKMFNEQLNVKLEGYLSPNTYNFFVDSDAKAITKVFLDQTLNIYNKYKSEFDNSNYDIHDIFTLASLTQYESGKYEDDLIIASVWYNRLDINMKLESSVTVCYSLYEFDDWIECEKNTHIDSPYNTYRNAGIPIGPVTNPGEMSIKATLMPKQSDYFFFIADVYGDGSIHFAKTYDEHVANVNKYLR